MGNFPYLLAIVLLIVWLIGFIGLHAGGLMHFLLIIAIIAMILRIIHRKKIV